MPLNPNFVGPSYNLDSLPSGVQRTINLIPVPQEGGNERTPWVFKDAPGLEAFSTAEDEISPYGSDIIYLMHTENTGTPATFIDSSTYAHTTLQDPGGITQTSAIGAFSTAGGEATTGAGTPQGLSAATPSAFAVTQDTSLTAEQWLYFLNVATPTIGASFVPLRVFVDIGGADNEHYTYRVSWSAAGAGSFLWRIDYRNQNFDSPSESVPASIFPFGEYFHVAYVYHGPTKTYGIAVNGIWIASDVYVGADFAGTITAIRTQNDTSPPPAGTVRFDEVRVIRHTTTTPPYTIGVDFTPPTSAFANP